YFSVLNLSTCRRQCWQLEKVANPRIYDLSSAGDHGFTNDFVLHVQLWLSVLHHVGEKRREIAGVHLAGMIRNAARQVDGTDDRDPAYVHRLPHAREFAVAAAFSRQVYDHGTGGHSLHHVSGD